jgi:hypothetical protein
MWKAWANVGISHSEIGFTPVDMLRLNSDQNHCIFRV